MITGDIADSPAVAFGTGTASPLTSAAFTPPGLCLVLVLAAAGWSGVTQAVLTCSDSSGGGNWTNPVTATGTSSNGGTSSIFYKFFTASPGSITVSVAFSGFASGSGGRLADIILLMGAAASQSGAATASKLSTTGLDGTFSITTTKKNSWVFGISDDSTNAAVWTPNAACSIDTHWENATDNVSTAAWYTNSYTGTPGATTVGGTWAANGSSNHTTQQCAFEVLPAADLPFKPVIINTQAIRSAYM